MLFACPLYCQKSSIPWAVDLICGLPLFLRSAAADKRKRHADLGQRNSYSFCRIHKKVRFEVQFHELWTVDRCLTFAELIILCIPTICLIKGIGGYLLAKPSKSWLSKPKNTNSPPPPTSKWDSFPSSKNSGGSFWLLWQSAVAISGSLHSGGFLERFSPTDCMFYFGRYSLQELPKWSKTNPSFKRWPMK